jgi:hypothetical protein
MTKETFLVLNLALAFYNVGTIWAHEIDIFRTWKLINDPKIFHTVQEVHWKKLPYWVFTPVGLGLLGSLALFWYHPDQILSWEIAIAFGAQLVSLILTAIFWGQWQAKLAKDTQGGSSIYLEKILKTHWIRTALINIYGLMLLWMTVQVMM